MLPSSLPSMSAVAVEIIDNSSNNDNNNFDMSFRSIRRCRRRQRRRGQLSSATPISVVLVALAATAVSLSSTKPSLVAGVGATIPPSLQINDSHQYKHSKGSHRQTYVRNQQQSSNIRGNSAINVIVAPELSSSAASDEGLPPVGSTIDVNNNSKRRSTIVVVQPNSIHQTTSGDGLAVVPLATKVHPWPIPEETSQHQQLVPPQPQQASPEKYSSVDSVTFRFKNNDDNVNTVVGDYSQQKRLQNQQPVQQYQEQQPNHRHHHQVLHVADYNMASLPQGNTADDMNDSAPTATLSSFQSSPLEDLDIVPGTKVILRPRLSNDNIKSIDSSDQPELKGTMLTPPASSLGINIVDNVSSSSSQSQPIIYYYDPQVLLSSPSVSQSSSSSLVSNNKNDGKIDIDLDTMPELTLPDVVYTSSGVPLTLEQVHAGGRNEVFLEIKKPKEAISWGSSEGNHGVSSTGIGGNSWNTIQNKLHIHSDSSAIRNRANAFSSTWHSQDQLIVLLTVATMAIMVGALSARRLRNQRILESCMHPDLDDDDNLEDFHVIGSVSRSNSSRNYGDGVLRFDKKHDGDFSASRSAVSGFSAITGSAGSRLKKSDFGALLGGSNGGVGGTYGTNSINGGGGGLHWRGGDMEKFDV